MSTAKYSAYVDSSKTCDIAMGVSACSCAVWLSECKRNARGHAVLAKRHGCRIPGADAREIVPKVSALRARRL